MTLPNYDEWKTRSPLDERFPGGVPDIDHALERLQDDVWGKLRVKRSSEGTYSVEVDPSLTAEQVVALAKWVDTNVEW